MVRFSRRVGNRPLRETLKGASLFYCLYEAPREPAYIPPKAGDYRAADKEQHRLSPSSGGTEGGTYGALMGGGTVGNPGIQPYKYGTKELDCQNGLDFGGSTGYDLAF